MQALAYINGSPCDPSLLQARALAYADGCFETIRCVSSEMPLWPFHRQRLNNAQQRLLLPINFSVLETQLLSISQQLSVSSAVIKLIVGRSVESRASYVLDNSSSDFYFLVREYVPSSRRKHGVRLKRVQTPLPQNTNFFGLKLLQRLDYIVPSMALKFDSDEEALFFDEHGNIVEGMHHNIFVLRGDTLITPPLLDRGVHGVMRQAIKSQLASQFGFKYKEEILSVDSLYDGDVFLTNAVEGVVPVCEFDGKNLHISDSLYALSQSISQVFEP